MHMLKKSRMGSRCIRFVRYLSLGLMVVLLFGCAVVTDKSQSVDLSITPLIPQEMAIKVLQSYFRGRFRNDSVRMKGMAPWPKRYPYNQLVVNCYWTDFESRGYTITLRKPGTIPPYFVDLYFKENKTGAIKACTAIVSLGVRLERVNTEPDTPSASAVQGTIYQPPAKKEMFLATSIGTVESINQRWGLVIIRLKEPSTIKVGQLVYAQGEGGRKHGMTIKRIAGDRASAVISGRLNRGMIGYQVLEMMQVARVGPPAGLKREESSGSPATAGSSSESAAVMELPRRASRISAGLYELEHVIDFNVLDKVFVNPTSGQITLIGHHDKRYGSRRIPYLQHLATLLENSHPQFSLNWTRQSEARVDQLFRRMDSDEEVRNMASKWGYWIDENQRVTPMGRFFMPLFGVTPTNDRYGVVASILRASGNAKGADIVDKAGTARRLMNRPGSEQAMRDVINASVAHESLGKLQAQARRGEINRNEFEIRIGRLISTGMDSAFGLTNQPVLRAFEQSIRRGRDLGTALTEAFRELDNQLRTVLEIAMDNLFRRHDQISVPPEVMQATLGIRPEVTPEYIGVDSRSQLARVMFEADRLGKQLPNMVDLQKKIPGYKTNFAFDRANPGKAGRFKPTTTHHLWISIDKFDLAQSKDGYTLATRGVKLRFNIREMKGGRSVPAPPGSYEKLLTSLYDNFAKEFPVLHELRETAKLKAAAEWLKTHKPNLRFPAAGRVPWNGPSKVPGLIYFTWTPNPRPGSVVASMVAMGGVSLVLPPRLESSTGVTIPLVPVDGLIVDLRPDRLVAVPKVGPARLTKFVPESAQGSIPRPLGWVTKGEVDGETVTAVTLVVGEGEEDGPTVLRRGSALDAQALIVWKRNDLEGAKQLCRRLARQSQDDPFKRAGYLALLGRILAENGEYEAAKRELDKAKQLAPDHPIFFMLNAEILVESGNIEEAISELEHYLSLDPENQAAAKVLGELREGWKGLRITPAASGEPRRRQHGKGVQAKGLISNKGRDAWNLAWALRAHGTRIQALKGKKGGEKVARGEGMQIFDTGRGDPEKAPPLSLTIRGREIKEVPEEVRRKPKWQELKVEYTALEEERKEIEKNISDLKEFEKSADMTAGEKVILKEILTNLVEERLPQVITKQNEVQKKAKEMISFHFGMSEEGKSREGEPEEGSSESRKGPPNKDPERNRGAP